MIAVLCAGWIEGLEEVPITGRRGFKIPWTREAWIQFLDDHHYYTASSFHHLRKLDFEPDLRWPAGHPSTVAIQRVFGRLLKANNLDPND